MAEKSFGVKEINLIGASGTPTIESPNNLNLNAVNVAISTNVSIGGTLSVTGNVSVGGTLTYEDVTNIDVVGIATFRDDVKINEDKELTFDGADGGKIYADGSNFLVEGTNSGGATYIRGGSALILSGGNPSSHQTTIYLDKPGGNGRCRLYYGGNSKLETTSTGIDVTGGITVDGSALSVDPTTSDIQVAYELLSTSSSSNGYRISGNGVNDTTANPDLYLLRGHKYRFINNSGGTHPFRIQSNNGTTLYSTGVTNNNASTGNIDFAPPNDAPQQLYYKCGNHSSMLGNIYIVGSFSKFSVSGQSDIVVDNLSSTMTFVAGSNMTITTNAASNAVTFAAAGGGGALEFVSKTTISSNTTNIDLTGLSYDTVYKLIIKRLEWTGYSQRSLLIKAFINGNSSVAGSIHDYSIDHPGTSNTAANSQSGWDFYQYGGENEHVTGTLEFYTGYYGYIRGPVHHVGLSNGVRYSHLYGTLNDASAPTNRISGLRLTNTGGQDWVSGGQVLLYKYKES